MNSNGNSNTGKINLVFSKLSAPWIPVCCSHQSFKPKSPATNHLKCSGQANPQFMSSGFPFPLFWPLCVSLNF